MATYLPGRSRLGFQFATGPAGTYAGLERAWPGAARGLLLGLAAALAAIALRLVVGTEVGRDQIVFSYPAVVVATLLFGIPAGAIAATVCLAVAWYYVVPPFHSFAIRDAAAATTLAVDLFTSATLVGTVGVMRLTLRRYRQLTDELEQRVERRTAERNRLWERSPELVAILDRDGTTRAANPALDALFGGQRPADLLAAHAAEDRGDLVAALSRLDGGAGSVAAEARLATPDGPAWIAWSAVRDGGQLYLVGRDITAERSCNEQLRQAQKMEAIGQLTGGLAHDFANLLMPIGMSLELVRARHADDPRTRATVDAAIESTRRAQALVDRLLAFARRQPSAPQSLDLAAHVRALEPLLRQSIGQRVLAVEIGSDLPTVTIDPSELDNALLNLVVNARDASPLGATITVALAPRPEGVALAVADHGTGMDADTLARAREPFFSTKARGQGTGLGLAQVSRFAENAGGEMRIESRPGTGTTVGLHLPAA